MKTYKGIRVGRATHVMVDDSSLNARLDLEDFAGKRFFKADPDANEFEWGSGENASKQLAFALLLNHGLTIDQVRPVLRPFLTKVVSWLPEQEWTLTSTDIDASLQEIVAKPA